MTLERKRAANLLAKLDLGSSVAENDHLLEAARVETSVFHDLLGDRVDLVPGTKGSGKSALYRICVDFLPQVLLSNRKVVVAHGVHKHGDSVFLAYKDCFETLSENDFIDFWCLYLISLANEQFIKDVKFEKILQPVSSDVARFRAAYRQARIPEFASEKKTLREILGWVLTALKLWKPKVKFAPPGDVGEFELELFSAPATKEVLIGKSDEPLMPQYIAGLKSAIESILVKTDLNLWLMVDRLDELFPRRSELERRALRALLRTLRVFESSRIRVKVFLRDDMFEQIVAGSDGFTALTHVTSRTADTLRWSESQIMTMVVQRLFSQPILQSEFDIDLDRLKSSVSYQTEAFYKVFPRAVHPGLKQSPTLRWIYSHVRDGRGVVTPRDVIDLLTRAGQRQRDEYNADPNGTCDALIGGQAIRYGLDELSRKKRTHHLEAEFPHLWPRIKKLVGGRTEYSEHALQQIYGRSVNIAIEDMVSIGVMAKSSREGKASFKIPHLYRRGLELSQGFSP